jgi:hypothetical protein
MATRGACHSTRAAFPQAACYCGTRANCSALSPAPGDGPVEIRCLRACWFSGRLFLRGGDGSAVDAGGRAGADDPPAGEDDLAGLSKDRLCTGGASGIAATACCAADRQRESAGSRTVSAVWVLLSTPSLSQCQGRAITTYCGKRKSSRRWQLSTDTSFSRRRMLMPVTDATDQPLFAKKECIVR